MTVWAGRRAQMRALLAADECHYPASVYDPGSARAAAAAGFPVCMLAGSVASLAILGAPDKVLITLSELSSLAGRIARVTDRPLLVDADHGYGNALNVARTVEELETVGVSGLTIEDTVLPSTYGTRGKAGLIPIEEGVGKLQAALASRVDPDLAIVGRTSGLTIVGLQETIGRAVAYERAGVDAMFIAGIRNEAELAALGSELSVPLILGPTAPHLVADRSLLAAHGVRICLQGHAAFSASVRAAHAVYVALRAGTAPEDLPGVADGGLMRLVTDAERYADYEARFLGVDIRRP